MTGTKTISLASEEGWSHLADLNREVSVRRAEAAIENQCAHDDEARPKPPADLAPDDPQHELESPEDYLARVAQRDGR